MQIKIFTNANKKGKLMQFKKVFMMHDKIFTDANKKVY